MTCFRQYAEMQADIQAHEAWKAAELKAARGPDYVAEPIGLSHIPPMLAAAQIERTKSELDQLRCWVFSDLENYRVARGRQDRFNEPATLVALDNLIATHETLLALVDSLLKEVKP